MEDTEKMRKNRRTIRFPKIAEALLFFMAVILLTGCQSGASVEMNTDLARQIAIDAAGVKAADLQDVNSVPENDGYRVTFSNNKGSYEIIVSGSGEVLSYQFNSSENPEAQKTAEENPSASDHPDPGEPKQNAGSPADHQDGADRSYTPVEGGMPSSELIQRVAAHLGLTAYADSDFKITPDAGQNLRIETLVDNARHFTVIINGVSGEIYSAVES